jgi:hypothetical protein
MHRLWSDGRWLKAFLAYGCYWHNCAFCDTTLDYIKDYEPVDVSAFYESMCEQVRKTGLRGLHLVDEAAPPASLLKLALLNRAANYPDTIHVPSSNVRLNFWGNIRFERAFTTDAAAILAAGGLIGVSAGLEVVTEAGLKRIGKGISLEDAVRACAAFKEAGILVHSYLIYGWWDQDEQEIIDSAEILRQFFEQGLLDSAFWHKFVLTRHSRIYQEEKSFAQSLSGPQEDERLFAYNDLDFPGEEKFDKYTEGLDRLLACWMAGETDVPVVQGFPFKVCKPQVSPALVMNLLDTYARDRDKGRAALPESGDQVLFLGSRPVEVGDASLYWRYRLEDCRLKTGDAKKAAKIKALLEEAISPVAAAAFYDEMAAVFGKDRAKSAWKTLRKSGLALM